MAKVTVTFEDMAIGDGLSIEVDPPNLFTINPHQMTSAQIVATQALLFIRDKNEVRTLPTRNPNAAPEAAAADGEKE